MLPNPLRKARGFTMIELITVMVLIGILAAVAAPRFFDRQGFDARMFADQTQFMLRYAQKLAVAQNRPVYVRFNAASVALCFDRPLNSAFPDCAAANQVVAMNNSASPERLAACAGFADWYCEPVPAGLALATAPATAYFYFDALGKPFAAANVSPTLLSTFVALTITVTGGGDTHAVVVEPETGYVH